MPANKPGVQSIKHYGAVSKATLAANIPNESERVAPLAPNRTLLVVQNTGANPGLLRFGEPCKGDGTDLVVAAGAFVSWDQADTCPVEAINLVSILGTSWAILEGLTPESADGSAPGSPAAEQNSLLRQILAALQGGRR